MNHRIEAIFFDLDGTLLDTAPDMGNAANKVLETHNYPPLTAEQIQINTHKGARGLLKAGFGNDIGKQDLEKLRRAFLHHYSLNICQGTKIYAGIVELLLKVNELGMSWGIVTNKPSHATHQLLNFFPILNKANTIVCADTQPFAKPHPAPLITACRILNVSPISSIYVGDIENDIIAAKAAGMLSGIATWGAIETEEKLIQWDADQIFKNPQEIYSYIR